MKILGINDAHNAAACLYQDGHIVAAIQEERLRRVKNWSGLPLQAVRAVLEMTGTPVGEIDAVAMNGHYAPNPMTREQLMEEYRTVNDPRVTARRALRRTVRRAMGPRLYTAYLGRRQRARVRDLLELGIPWEKIDFVEHHTAHAAAAYYGWGKFEDPVLVLTCDGVGDGLCATVSIGRNGHLERLHAVGEGDSIGNIYAMVTFLMGMVPLEHEYKLMGLAPYADPRGADQVFRELARLIRVDPKAPLGWERVPGCPETYYSHRFFSGLLERKRFDSVAGGMQKFTEYVVTEWVRRCVRETGIHRLALSGGVFMNVKANKAIMDLPEVEDLFVYPSSYEGFGIPVVEAMACGVPTITLRNSALSEFGAAAHYCEDGSAESLYHGMRAVAESPQLRDELTTNGRRRAHDYLWGTIASRTMDALAAVARR